MMEAPSLIGMGVGFAVVGLIYSLLAIYKPDIKLFQKYTPLQFHRSQGLMAMFLLFGLLLVFEGCILTMGVQEGENPAAALMGAGAGLAIVFCVLSVLSIKKPEMSIWRGAEGKKLWQMQGAFLGCTVFGVVFFLEGLLAKPWAV